MSLTLIVPLLFFSSLSQGTAALESQRYPEAIQYFESALEEKESYEARYGLARAQAFSGDYTSALKSYNQLLIDYPGNVDVLLGRAQVQAWLKNYAEAEQDYALIIEKSPNYTAAWTGLMNVYIWQEKAAAIESLFERWKTQQSDSPAPYLSRARWFFNQRQFTEARQDLQQAKTLGATEAEVSPLLTRMNRQQGALPWEASLSYEFQGFTERNSPWHTVTGGLKYNFDRASVAVQSISTQRFDLFDQGFVADGYFDLWSGAYGNLRAQWVPDADVLPQFDVLGELYQTFAETWEVSGAYRLMSYPSNQIHFVQGSVGKYWGNWYFRAQPILFFANNATQEAGPGGNLTLWARYYYGTVDDYVEMRTGLGRRIAVVGSSAEEGATLQGQTNAFGLISAQHFFTPQLGLVGTLNYNYDQQFPDRFGASLGSLYRF